MPRSSNNDDLITLIFTTTSIVRKQNAGCVAPLSLVQLKILSMLATHRSLTMKEIADLLYITPPSATALVNHLVKDKTAERIIDKKDRRLVRLKITPKGKRFLKKQRKEAAKRMNKILSNLNNKEKGELKKILNKIIKNYNRQSIINIK